MKLLKLMKKRQQKIIKKYGMGKTTLMLLFCIYLASVIPCWTIVYMQSVMPMPAFGVFIFYFITAIAFTCLFFYKFIYEVFGNNKVGKGKVFK